MTDERIRAIVKKIEARIKLFQSDPRAQHLQLNEYDAIEAVLRAELKGVE